MYAVKPGIKNSPLSGLLNALFDLFLNLPDNLFYPCRMDPSVGNKPFQRYLCNLPSYGIMARQYYGLGGILSYHVNPGYCLDCADVPAFPSYNPSLPFVVWKR